MISPIKKKGKCTPRKREAFGRFFYCARDAIDDASWDGTISDL